jgi:hypothetical protein
VKGQHAAGLGRRQSPGLDASTAGYDDSSSVPDALSRVSIADTVIAAAPCGQPRALATAPMTPPCGPPPGRPGAAAVVRRAAASAPGGFEGGDGCAAAEVGEALARELRQLLQAGSVDAGARVRGQGPQRCSLSSLLVPVVAS